MVRVIKIYVNMNVQAKVASTTASTVAIFILSDDKIVDKVLLKFITKV